MKQQSSEVALNCAKSCRHILIQRGCRVGTDFQRVMEVVNITWCSWGQNKWAANKSTTKTMQLEEIKSEWLGG